MSRSFANGLGIAAIVMLGILIGNDIQSMFHVAVAFPGVLQELVIAAVGVLAGAYLVYRIVRGRPLDPSFSEEKLRGFMEDAVRKVMREEFENLAGEIIVREMESSRLGAVPVQRQTPRPHLIRSNDGS